MILVGRDRKRHGNAGFFLGLMVNGVARDQVDSERHLLGGRRNRREQSSAHEDANSHRTTPYHIHYTTCIQRTAELARCRIGLTTLPIGPQHSVRTSVKNCVKVQSIVI